MNLDRLMRRAKRVGFTRPEVLPGLCRPTWRLLLKKAAPGQALMASRIGGLPALPAGRAWPMHKGKCLGFVGQLNLAELPKEAWVDLPKAGLLSFFYETEDCCWGGDAGIPGRLAVWFTEEGVKCSRVKEWPDDLASEARFQACSVEFVEGLALAPEESALVRGLKLSEEDRDRYMDLPEVIHPGGSWAERSLLLGHPDQIQGDLSEMFARNALRTMRRQGKVQSSTKGWKAIALESRQLLQVHSVRKAGMMWGDLGCLYFWMRESDLRAGNFERVWGIQQCG